MIAAKELDTFLTVTEAAKEIGATRGCVHYHLLAGRLQAFRIGDRYVIPRESVEQLRRDRAARLGQSETPERS